MAYVPTQSVIWAHGSGVNLGSTNGLRITKSSGGCTIFSDVQNLSVEATLSIPTPALLHGKPVTATAVLIRFTSQGAEINNLSILDNQATIAVTSTNSNNQLRFPVNPGHAIFSGAGVDMILHFSQLSGYVQIVAAGIEFTS